MLQDFSSAERALLGALRGEAADAVEEIIGAGLVAAMNRFNTRKDANSDKKTDKKTDSKDEPKKKPDNAGDAR